MDWTGEGWHTKKCEVEVAYPICQPLNFSVAWPYWFLFWYIFLLIWVKRLFEITIYNHFAIIERRWRWCAALAIPGILCGTTLLVVVLIFLLIGVRLLFEITIYNHFAIIVRRWRLRAPLANPCPSLWHGLTGCCINISIDRGQMPFWNHNL